MNQLFCNHLTKKDEKCKNRICYKYCDEYCNVHYEIFLKNYAPLFDHIAEKFEKYENSKRT